MNDENRLEIKVGKVHKVGGSLMIILPPRFVEINNIEAGDELAIVACDDEVKIQTGPKHNIYRFHAQSQQRAQQSLQSGWYKPQAQTTSTAATTPATAAEPPIENEIVD